MKINIDKDYYLTEGSHYTGYSYGPLLLVHNCPNQCAYKLSTIGYMEAVAPGLSVVGFKPLIWKKHKPNEEVTNKLKFILPKFHKPAPAGSFNFILTKPDL